MDEAACDTVTSLQSDVADCQATVRECLVRLAGQGGALGGSRAQCAHPTGSLDPESGS